MLRPECPRPKRKDSTAQCRGSTRPGSRQETDVTARLTCCLSLLGEQTGIPIHNMAPASTIRLVERANDPESAKAIAFLDFLFGYTAPCRRGAGEVPGCDAKVLIQDTIAFLELFPDQCSRRILLAKIRHVEVVMHV